MTSNAEAVRDDGYVFDPIHRVWCRPVPGGGWVCQTKGHGSAQDRYKRGPVPGAYEFTARLGETGAANPEKPSDTGEMVSHLASVVNELQEENERLKARAQALLDKMDLCEEALDGILRMAAVHGLKYSGPTYTEEKFELGAAVRGVPTVNKDCGS